MTSIDPIQLFTSQHLNGQELKVAKDIINFQIGQILKAFVVQETANGEVTLNIQGQHVQAKTSQQFSAHEQLNVKVTQNKDEVILKVIDPDAQAITPSTQTNPLQTALAQLLPKQLPATHLVSLLNFLTKQVLPKPGLMPQEETNVSKEVITPKETATSKEAITPKVEAPVTERAANTIWQTPQLKPIAQQIQQLAHSFLNVSHLREELPLAIKNSGYFFENKLLNLVKLDPKQQQLITKELPQATSARPIPLTHAIENLQLDFKSQLANLLSLLQTIRVKPANTNTQLASAFKANTYASTDQLNTIQQAKPEHDPLPLPGANPQPHARIEEAMFKEMPLPHLLSLLQEQTEHVLARIQTGQVNHLLQTNQIPDQAYTMLLEIPVQHEDEVNLISFLLEKAPHQTPQGGKQWTVTFALELSILGSIQAKISLDQDNIAVHLYVAEENTLKLLEKQRTAFADLLQTSGLKLTHWILEKGLLQENVQPGQFRFLDINI